ncbi:MAG: transposase, partial [Deltaproteobacteria bacterium]|nr:transposase [Deltaproteobacteria bacterium]
RGTNRPKLERLCRYLLRPPVAEDRLSLCAGWKCAPPPQDAMARWDESHRPSARGATRKARSADSAPLREPHRLSRRARTEREVAPRGR